MLEIDDSESKISFYQYVGTLSIGTIFHEPQKREEIWVDFVNLLYVFSVSAETRRRKKFKKFVLENMMEIFSAWKNKN